MWTLLKRATGPQSSPWNESETIRGELFGRDRLCEHAQSLARLQPGKAPAKGVYSVVKRLRDNTVTLSSAYKELCAAIAADKPVTPAAEWLVDNFHLIEEQARQAAVDLPPGYYRQLPKITVGPLAGHPQIFGIAWAYVTHTDSLLEPNSLTEFINAYQEVQPLTIGELWAAAISLRLVMIENLARIASRNVAARRAREAADHFVLRALDPHAAPVDMEFLLSPDSQQHVTLSFAVQLIKRLRDRDAVDASVYDWVHQKVAALGYDFETAVTEEHHRQAAANVTMRNLVMSLRFISDYNWEDWFDTVSTVDKLLRTCRLYGEMDFRTRNNYRSAVEDLSKYSNYDELTIARMALASGEAKEQNLRTDEPGYHIVGPGRADFETFIGYRPNLQRRLADVMRKAGLTGYLGVIIFFATAGLYIGLSPINSAGLSIPVLIILALSGLGVVFDAATAMVNYAATQLLRPVVLPGLALRDGVPDDLRTIVVVPSLLISTEAIEELVEHLEVHYLANTSGEVYFALLTDWTDNLYEHAPHDEALLLIALEGIARLNEKYQTNKFLLLHRHRVWNARQNQWMGWERKRGKLHELNQLLRGRDDTTFMVVGGKLPGFVRYIITLDADTKFPRDAARRLIGKISHPLNRPRFDPLLGRVIEGYGILQPRVAPSLPMRGNGSLYQRIFSTRRGSDPYVFAVSDVYQDLFGEGSFAGKGIYDIDAFEATLAGRIPDNRVLSHDLFEGNVVRAALVSDIEVVEEYPERYTVAAARQHRWVRGDWQLLEWIIGIAPSGPSGRLRPQPALGLWKMIDNLRRSLTPVLSILALFAGWILLPGALAAGWTMFITITAFIPAILPIFSGSNLQRIPLSISSQLHMIATDFAQAMTMGLSNLLLLAHQAGLMLDAIIRSLFRMFISHRNLLEWMTAAQVESSHESTLPGVVRLMAVSIVLGMAALLISILHRDGVAVSVLPFALLWIFAPLIAWRASQLDLPADELAASPAERIALRIVARRTWHYFETYVGAEDNFLPPDNFQEDPKDVVAHRTSPTNIGLYLLSVASAREFGWLDIGEVVGRLEATLATIHKMEKFEGHLYNWYDTESLHPLEPRYVSAVDSGNLAGHLIALSNICEYWTTHSPGGLRFIEGINDVTEIVSEEIALLAQSGRNQKIACGYVEERLIAFRRTMEKSRQTPEHAPLRLIDLAVQCRAIHDSIGIISSTVSSVNITEAMRWAGMLRDTVENQFKEATLDSNALKHVYARLQSVAVDARTLSMNMQFGFLCDPKRNLMSIGYRVSEGTLDESCYDLLASEASLASFVAIAKGDLRARHWFRLGRPVTTLPGGPALISWSGSMFEYLMSGLVMHAPAGSLIERTSYRIVRSQIEYGNSVSTPWGISESAFGARDRNFTYQYSNFGVPGLGLKRGLSDNLVIAPYATALAAMVAPKAATANFMALNKIGARGKYGYYEALDFTPSRLRSGETVSIIKSYFAHHQGMTIAAILNAVHNGFIRKQFHSDPIVRATELLLQERAPRHTPVKMARSDVMTSVETARDIALPPLRRADPRQMSHPATHLLSNGQYTVMMTGAGAGYSTWNGVAINRWREDATIDNWGAFVFLRDTANGVSWSANYLPAIAEPDSYSAIFSDEKAEIHRTDGNFTTSLECLVSTEDNAEARRINIVNSGFTTRTVELTTYMELALAPFSADDAHPAFSKLFIETEFLNESGALLATRRRRNPGDPEIWVAQFILVQGMQVGGIEYETDRRQFLGQGNDINSASALNGDQELSKSTGAVLDPVFVHRRSIRIPPGRQVSFIIWTMVANSRDGVLDMVDRHRQQVSYERAQILAWTQSRVQLRYLSIDSEEADIFQSLAGNLIFSNNSMRASSNYISSNIRPQTMLWPQGISGVKPILLARIDAVEDIDVIKQLLRAHEYWNFKRLAVDLVILNDRRASYIQDLQLEIEDLIRKRRTDIGAGAPFAPGQIYALRADLLPQETLAMLPAVARVVINCHAGDLASHVVRGQAKDLIKLPVSTAGRAVTSRLQPELKTENDAELVYFNGYGGFTRDGKEYVILHNPRNPTPAPWINVIANAAFGTHCAADGGGYTWVGNSREYQITAWANDPVSNRPSEAVYVRDERSGVITGPCISPLNRAKGKYRTRHGFGYTIHEAEDDGLRMEYTQFVPLNDTVKIGRLRISSDSTTPRQLSVTFYSELVLGFLRSVTGPFVTTEMDAQTGAFLARNRWNADFPERVVFADMAGQQSSWTGDRLDFLGPYGNLAAPRAVTAGAALSNRTGGGFDPCAALQQKITVVSGQPAEIKILLGAAENMDEARKLIARYRDTNTEVILSEINIFWSATLGTVKVATPDPAFDFLLNGWLQYQTLSCRMWGRSGLYQASGAYGFRDQLQDSMALSGVVPEIAREHILRAAGRQFVEGDVQHWWLPENGIGVRTRISDDTVWLAYCVAHYIRTTADVRILDEVVPFLKGRSLEEGEHDAFYKPEISERTATLYEHCVLGLARNLEWGVHGLPLMGTGDWNDGMNRVGENGRGESVWLAWFLYATLKVFEPIAIARGDYPQALAWRKAMSDLQYAVDANGWDGKWYRRGFFDDGSPLGSVQNKECQIDAIAQSWAVLSGAGSSERAAAALDEAYRRLVWTETGIAVLFTPPFNNSMPDPGYVKAYPPGIRENGGQYSHGAIWSIFAHAKLGQAEKAAGLFSMINPINHARNEIEAKSYRVEPYVMTGDVYSVAPYIGRGGWSWYTGASGWMYRAGLEAILGIVREGAVLKIKPCIPASWKEFQVSVKFHSTVYEITVSREPQPDATPHPQVKMLSPGEFIVQMQDIGGSVAIRLELES